NRYYITNIKDELRYYQPNISKNNIIELVQESLSESNEEPVEDNEAIILSNLNDP
ncbi:17543_t:CDS:1, partial [Funneliformis geosporum]